MNEREDGIQLCMCGTRHSLESRVSVHLECQIESGLLLWSSARSAPLDGLVAAHHFARSQATLAEPLQPHHHRPATALVQAQELSSDSHTPSSPSSSLPPPTKVQSSRCRQQLQLHPPNRHTRRPKQQHQAALFPHHTPTRSATAAITTLAVTLSPSSTQLDSLGIPHAHTRAGALATYHGSLIHAWRARRRRTQAVVWLS